MPNFLERLPVVKLLLTGSTGFVGAAVMRSLVVDDAYEVRVLSRSAATDLSSATDHVTEAGDWREADFSKALRDVSVIVHLAARVHVMQEAASDPIAAFRAVNVDATLNLARQAAVAGVKRFVFISSVKVNGEATPPSEPFLPDAVPAPQDAYGISKMEAEQGLRQIAARTGLEVVIIRPPLVYGPGVKANFAALMRAVKRGLPLPFGAVHNQRSLVGLDNLVSFIVACATHPKAANQTFLISDGQDLSTPELIRKMAAVAGVSACLWPLPVWVLQAGARLIGKGDAVQRLCGNLQVNISKAQALLDWVPPVSVDDGLAASFVIPAEAGVHDSRWKMYGQRS
jgi:nucleoside-diphosphate-sugar epimerase